MSHVKWTDQAVADVQTIREFIERDSPRYGRLVAERLVSATERLEAFPRSGRIVPEVGREDLREIVVGVYRIVYRLELDAAVLLTVFRGSMLFPRDVMDF